MFKRIAACACFMAFFAGSAMAADAEFQIEQGVLGWSSLNIETKPDGGDTVKSKEDTIYTMPSNLELGMFLGKVNFYVYPTQGGTPFAVGFQATKELEVGGMLAINSSKVDKPVKGETSKNEYGVWATYAMPLGANALEFDLSILMNSGTKIENTTTNGVSSEVKTTSSGMEIAPSVSFVLPLAKNLSWVGGLGYTMDSQEQKAGDAKQKVSTSGLGLNLTTLRMTF